MLRRSVGLWLALAGVLYAGVAAWRADPERPSSWVGLALGPLCLLVGFLLTAPPRRGVDSVRSEARAAARAAVSGATLALVAELAPAEPAFAVARMLGIGLAASASLVALVRASSLGGLAALPLRRAHLDAAVLAALLWIAAAGLRLARALAVP